MQYYLDSSDVAEVRRLVEIFPLAGVTTNPSIIARAQRPFLPLVKELRDIVGSDKTLFFQVVGHDADTMQAEADFMREVAGPDVSIKLPVTVAGYRAMRLLARKGVSVTATAILDAQQALIAAECGARFVAPYVNRRDTHQGNGVELVAQTATLLDRGGYATKILAASFKSAHQINQVALAGAHAATVAPAMMATLIQHPLTDASLQKFDSDWQTQYPGSTSVIAAAQQGSSA